MSSASEHAREDARLRALRIIEANPKLTQRELAAELGISLGATHYLLKAFSKAGFVRIARFTASSNKKAYAYILTPKGMSEKRIVASRFLARKREEYEALKREIDELGAELKLKDIR